MRMNNQFDLREKTAVVTGGGRGLGMNLAKSLAEAGAKVLIASRDENSLRTAATEISENSGGGQVLYTTVDLSNRDSTKALVGKATEILGKVDIFVGNSGIDCRESVDQISDEAFDQTMEVNFAANAFLMKGFAPQMKEHGWGRIIFISSVAAYISGDDKMTIYGASKSALHAMAKAAAVELGPYKITVNCLVPGLFMTPMAEDFLSRDGNEIYDVLARVTAERRWGDPKELEGAVLLLASEAGSYITGSELVVDGGMSSRNRPWE